MSKFERTQDMEDKMVMDSFGGAVAMDIEIEFRYQGNKLKAYSHELKSYLQFPRKLREPYAKFICDCTEAQNNGRTFYRAYKGTIRDMDGEVVG